MISIIVPVYNAEKTIRRCVDSILCQSYRDWELLLVNDGSRDNSLSICEEYAISDSRVKVLSKENGGVSSARNMGLDHAQGEWITFVDSDDYIGEYYFDEIPERKEDLIVYNLESFGNQGNCMPIPHAPIKICSNKSDLNDYLRKYLRAEELLSPWGKFYKKELIGEIRFLAGQILGEDTIFVQSYLKKCNTFCVSGASCYFYYDAGFDFCKKYQMKVSEAKTQLFNIFDSYLKLGIECQEFVSFELELFRKTCSEDLFHDPSLWYGDNRIQKIHAACKEFDGWKGQVKYTFFRISYLYRIFAKYLK